MSQKIVRIIGQLNKVTVNRSGGGRLELDFGSDSFNEVLEIQKFFKDNNIEVGIALTPITNYEPDFIGTETTSEELEEFQPPDVL